MERTRKNAFAFVCMACLLAACLGLFACGGSGSGGSTAAGTYKDGTYTGQSSVLDANVDGDGYAVVDITIKDGKIVDASMQAFQVDGTPKDKDYGKDGAYYAVAQKAVSTGDDYVKQLIETGTPDGVDAVSGATMLYDQFQEAVADALKQASK